MKKLEARGGGGEVSLLFSESFHLHLLYINCIFVLRFFPFVEALGNLCCGV